MLNKDLRERTLILIKPDAIKRNLIPEILSRISNTGLKIIGLKMMRPNKEKIQNHYPNTIEWLEGMGNKTINLYNDYGVNLIDDLGTDEPLKIGEIVQERNVEYLLSGPIVACVIEGIHAIDVVRKICGNTMPRYADSGTIRGDFSTDSAIFANSRKRAVKNLVHASSNKEEAKKEINYWFKENEIFDYLITDEVELV